MHVCVYVCTCASVHRGLEFLSSDNSAGVKCTGYALKVFSSFQMRPWVELVDQEESKVLDLID